MSCFLFLPNNNAKLLKGFLYGRLQALEKPFDWVAPLKALIKNVYPDSNSKPADFKFFITTSRYLKDFGKKKGVTNADNLEKERLDAFLVAFGGIFSIFLIQPVG
ncbi:hypothetical protein NC652_035017 [Populus alba x Populus x berolinensis]|nr:hypothetical protein NC652_035017 [Populus alba x Populus x berolinensis]